MAIVIENTPNPNALKFTVGAPVGGPATFAADSADDHPVARDVVEVDGVTSMFLTADFVTVTKDPGADWSAIAPVVQAILERHYPG
jgi:hypothetical protein